MKAYERLLKYVVVRTPSDEESGKSPSSECQFKLAGLLKDEMTELGLSDVKLDKHCYLYGRLPATKGLEKLPSIGFIAHMDTVSDYCNDKRRCNIQYSDNHIWKKTSFLYRKEGFSECLKI